MRLEDNKSNIFDRGKFLSRSKKERYLMMKELRRIGEANPLTKDYMRGNADISIFENDRRRERQQVIHR